MATIGERFGKRARWADLVEMEESTIADNHQEEYAPTPLVVRRPAGASSTSLSLRMERLQRAPAPLVIPRAQPDAPANKRPRRADDGALVVDNQACDNNHATDRADENNMSVEDPKSAIQSTDATLPAGASETTDGPCPSTCMSNELTPEDREVKRKSYVATIKCTPGYAACKAYHAREPNGEAPQTPDASDRKTSKRRWEEACRVWRNGLKDFGEIPYGRLP
jgi:hypothetical protein